MTLNRRVLSFSSVWGLCASTAVVLSCCIIVTSLISCSTAAKSMVADYLFDLTGRSIVFPSPPSSLVALYYMTPSRTVLTYNNNNNNNEYGDDIMGSAVTTTISTTMIPSILILLFVLSGFSLLWTIKPSHVPKSVPGPPRIPFLGYLKYVIDHWETWPTEVVKLSDQYGRTWGGPFPNLGGLGGACFFVVDEQCVRHILQDSFDTYEKGDAFRKWLSDLLGNGIFAADGEEWRIHRKISSHFFSRNLLRHSGRVTKSKLDEIVHVLNHRIDNHHHHHDKTFHTVVDIQDMFYRMTMDVVAYIAFGAQLDSIRREQQHPFALAFDQVQALSHARIVDPFFRFKRYLALTSRERNIQRGIKSMKGFTDSVIRSKRRSAENGGKLGPDLISRYLDRAKQIKEDPPSVDALHYIVMNFVLAGRDTTACALSWTFYELSKHTHVVDKIIQEVNTVCGTGPNADYSYEAIAKLRYTHAVAMEALRLHPSVPGDAKYAIKDDVLPDGTFIPKGSMVNYYPFYLGRTERIWGPDALEFKPERFLNKAEPSPFLLPVFNAGYRTCLGKNLALMNMKLTMACLLPKFEFIDVNHHSGEYKWTLVRSMKGGFPVKVIRRT